MISKCPDLATLQNVILVKMKKDFINKSKGNIPGLIINRARELGAKRPYEWYTAANKYLYYNYYNT